CQVKIRAKTFHTSRRKTAPLPTRYPVLNSQNPASLLRLARALSKRGLDASPCSAAAALSRAAASFNSRATA
uniref:Uncharacterized protein n=1 Tax=Zonotrichia albicollis TaxID=44394 RepID=A0A8D2MFX0_ZONAL